MNAPRRIAVLSTLAFAVAASLLAAPREVSACSPLCDAASVPYEGQALPAGVRALPVPFSNQGADPVLTLGGVVVPSTLKVRPDASRLLVPSAPLADGAYTLAYEQQCGETGKATAAFTVGAIVPEPRATGTLRVATQFVPGVKREGKPNSGDCQSLAIEYDHVVAQVTFEPAAELGSYLSLTEFSADLAASGQPWKKTFAVSPTQTKAPYVIASFIASCESGTPSGTAPGIYSMSVSGQIAGFDGRLASSTAAIDLTCPPGGAAASTPGAASGSSGSGTSGCTVSSSAGGPAGGLGAFCLGAAATAILARRRRRNV